MSRLVLFYLVLCTLFFGRGVFAAGIGFNYTRCAKILVSQSRFHRMSSTSKAYTQEAINMLKYFQENAIPHTNDGRAHYKPVTTSHKASKEKKRALNLRINEILHEHETGESLLAGKDGEPGTGNNTLVGAHFVGEDVVTELQGREDIFGENGVNRSREIFRENFLNALMPLITLSLISAPVFEPILGALFLYFLRDIPELTYRSLGVYHLSGNQNKNLLAKSTSIKPGEWHSHSFDLLISKEVTQRIWATGETDGDLDMAGIWSAQSYPEHSVRLVKTRSGKQPPKAWVRVDEILFMDPGDNELHLLTFLRLTDDRKKYPKPSPEKQKKKSDSKASDPVTIPGSRPEAG